MLEYVILIERKVKMARIVGEEGKSQGVCPFWTWSGICFEPIKGRKRKFPSELPPMHRSCGLCKRVAQSFDGQFQLLKWIYLYLQSISRIFHFPDKKLEYDGKVAVRYEYLKVICVFSNGRKQKMHNIIFIVKYTLKMVVLILGLTSSTNDFPPIYIYLGTFRVW